MIIEDLCNILGVAKNAPFNLSSNKNIIYKVTDKDVYSYRINHSNAWHQVLYRDVLYLIEHKEYIQMLYWKPPMGGTYYFPKLDSEDLYGKSQWMGTDYEQHLYAHGLITDSAPRAIDLAKTLLRHLFDTRFREYRMEL